MISPPATAPLESTAELLLIGAGGHARVVADAAALSQTWLSISATDRNPERCSGALLPGVALLSLAAALAHVDAVNSKCGLHIAIGDCAARQREALAFCAADPQRYLVSVVHPRACVSPHAKVASGCFVAAFALVGPGAQLGEGVIVNHGAVVDHDVQVGAFCHIAPNATLGGGARLGQRVLVGAGAVVLPGICLGDDVVLGAGAVATADLPAPGIYTGIPAQLLRHKPSSQKSA